MAQADWTELLGSLGTASVARGVTAGSSKPPGGGNFVYGFHSLAVSPGAVGLHANQTDFAPTAKGGSVRGAFKRGPSAGPTGFSPFLFICLQGTSVGDGAYLLGLTDEDPARLALVKGPPSGGVPAGAPNPPTNNILMVSDDTFAEDEWVHARLDAILQPTGDVLLQVYVNDLAANDVLSPVWTTPAGMEGPQHPSILGFVDDVLGVNTGSPPYTSGRIGFGFQTADVNRRAYFDHLEVARQL